MSNSKEHGENSHAINYLLLLWLMFVDSNSTLAYFGSTAYEGSGILAPISAIFVKIVMFSLLGPMYSYLVSKAPDGKGAPGILGEFLSGWSRFMATNQATAFLFATVCVTVSMSASDGYEHQLHDANLGFHLGGHIIGICLIIATVGIMYWLIPEEKISTLLLVTCIFFTVCMFTIICYYGWIIITEPQHWKQWTNRVITENGSWLNAAKNGIWKSPPSFIGCSGTEMLMYMVGLIAAVNVADRIHKAKILVWIMVAVMGLGLFGSGLVTTLMIPDEQLIKGGQAYGQSMGYLASQMNPIFGTAVKVTVVLMLIFAGFSAFGGGEQGQKRNLMPIGGMPKRLGTKGAQTLLMCSISILLVIVYKGDPILQTAPYTTSVFGVLTLAAIAAVLSSYRDYRKKEGSFVWFMWMCLALLICGWVFTIMLFSNIMGLAYILSISAFFFLYSTISRAVRSTELRINKVIFNKNATETIKKALLQSEHGNVRLVAINEDDDLEAKHFQYKKRHSSNGKPIIFVKVLAKDPSLFVADEIIVREIDKQGYGILRVKAPGIPNGLAAIALAIEEQFNAHVHLNVYWSHRSVGQKAWDFIIKGEGDIAPTVAEILKKQGIDLCASERITLHVA
jgi:hypothetical protein